VLGPLFPADDRCGKPFHAIDQRVGRVSGGWAAKAQSCMSSRRFPTPIGEHYGYCREYRVGGGMGLQRMCGLAASAMRSATWRARIAEEPRAEVD
jgi:hypothetical protein